MHRLFIGYADDPVVLRFCVVENTLAFALDPLRLLNLLRQFLLDFLENISDLPRIYHNFAGQRKTARSFEDVFDVLD